MKKFWFKIFLAILLSGILAPCLIVRAQDYKNGQSLGVETQSRSAFLYDMAENKPIFTKNSDTVLPLASLTKLMTALVVYKNQPVWDEQVKIQATDMRKKGGVPHLIAGEEVKRDDLWNLMLIASSNESAAALARSLGISEEKFVEEMNAEAKDLGLRHLVFQDPTGLDPGNQGTAREVAALARVVFSIPKVRASLIKTSYSFTPRDKKTRYIKSTDALLSSFLNKNPYQVISGKTGYLEESQYNLVFAAGKNEVAQKNSLALNKSKQLIGVVLGSLSNEDRFQEMKSLIYWGFEKRGEIAKK